MAEVAQAISPVEYTPTQWQDGADGGTPITAASLNNIEKAVEELAARTAQKIVAEMIEDGAVTSGKLDKDLLAAATTAAIGTSRIADKAVTTAKLADLSVTTAKLAANSVTKDKLSPWVYVGAVADIGHLYTCGRIGRIEIYCKKTAALAAWKYISGTLPGGIKAAEVSRAALLCEDKPTYLSSAVVDGNTLMIYNRSSTNWPASTGGFYIVGQVVFPLA